MQGLQPTERTKWGRSLLAIATATLFLTACATTGFDLTPKEPAPAPITNTGAGCPILKEYSQQFQDRLRTELEVLSPDSAIVTAVGDYQNLREQTRECRRQR